MKGKTNTMAVFLESNLGGYMIHAGVYRHSLSFFANKHSFV